MKFALAVAAGVAAAKLVAPKVQNALDVPATQGFGTDDLIELGIAVGAAYLIRSVL
ncbi:MAG TPA: hypothetical protein VNO22_02860 [Planctomycetota bacterium]|nr:hypothetical protein [Planctomycetota bacterium]